MILMLCDFERLNFSANVLYTLFKMNNNSNSEFTNIIKKFS